MCLKDRRLPPIPRRPPLPYSGPGRQGDGLRRDEQGRLVVQRLPPLKPERRQLRREGHQDTRRRLDDVEEADAQSRRRGDGAHEG